MTDDNTRDELRELLLEIRALADWVRGHRRELDDMEREADHIFSAGEVTRLRYDVLKEKIRRTRASNDKSLKFLQHSQNRALWLLKELESRS